jgi:hypothetical protein
VWKSNTVTQFGDENNDKKRHIKVRRWTLKIICIHKIFTIYQKGTHPARLGLIWFSGFRGEDLNVIFYQNMPNLHNRYISAERKISQKNTEYMLAVTKNRFFFKWPKLLYFKPECAQI